MRKPINNRPSGAGNAFPIPRHKHKAGDKQFYVPPTIQSDFKDWLYTDVPNVNYTFELIRDWFEKDAPGYKPEYLRATYFPINWKSKLGMSDANSNFKTHHGIDIKKGDIVVREDGTIYMLNWKVQQYPNNLNTQAIDCNAHMEFTRHVPEEVDASGYLVREAHEQVIVPSLPCVYSEYAGRPEYSVSFNAPGIAADHLIVIQVQYNPMTKGIRMGDNFALLNHQYRIVNWNSSEIDIDRQYGIIN